MAQAGHGLIACKEDGIDKVEKVARAMARADGIDPDHSLRGYKRIFRQMIPVFRYDPELPAWTYYVPIAKVFIGAAAELDRS